MAGLGGGGVPGGLPGFGGVLDASATDAGADTDPDPDSDTDRP